MTKFILDFDLLKEHNITLDKFITLLKIYKDLDYDYESDNLDELQADGFIKVIKNDKFIVILREKSKLLLQSLKYEEPKIFKESKSISKFNSFEDFVLKEYRSLWDGLKPGSMGSKADCLTKMRKWMISNPDYTQEDILKAARSYINSVDDLRFLQQADYFIYKKDKYTETSRLSAFIDETEVFESGWSSDLK